MGVHWKIRFLGLIHNKKQYIGGFSQKEGFRLFADLRGGWRDKKEGGVFEGDWYPNARYGLTGFFLGVKL